MTQPTFFYFFFNILLLLFIYLFWRSVRMCASNEPVSEVIIAAFTARLPPPSVIKYACKGVIIFACLAEVQRAIAKG